MEVALLLVLLLEAAFEHMKEVLGIQFITGWYILCLFFFRAYGGTEVRVSPTRLDKKHYSAGDSFIDSYRGMKSMPVNMCSICYQSIVYTFAYVRR